MPAPWAEAGPAAPSPPALCVQHPEPAGSSWTPGPHTAWRGGCRGRSGAGSFLGVTPRSNVRLLLPHDVFFTRTCF